MNSESCRAIGFVGTIVLAAGASTRMGELGAKQLLAFGGRTLIRHATEVTLAAENGPVVVVLGANADRVRPEIADLHVELVTNESWNQGIGTSIRAGIAALLRGACAAHLRAAIVMTADQPLICAQVLRGLVEAHRQTGSPIAASDYGGTVGTPALFSRALFEELLSQSPDVGAKQLITSDLRRVALVRFPGGERDIDTPADYQLALADLVQRTRASVDTRVCSCDANIVGWGGTYT